MLLSWVKGTTNGIMTNTFQFLLIESNFVKDKRMLTQNLMHYFLSDTNKYAHIK